MKLIILKLCYYVSSVAHRCTLKIEHKTKNERTNVKRYFLLFQNHIERGVIFWKLKNTL